jgi:anti-anti-sigma factor
LAYSIQSEPDPNGPLISLAGDADLGAAADLEEMVIGAVANGERSIRVDLSEATLIDSRTIAVLVEWTEKLSEAKGSLRVICSNPNILRLLARIGLDRTLTVVATREEGESD